jgi:hypothetical protein
MWLYKEYFIVGAIALDGTGSLLAWTKPLSKAASAPVQMLKKHLIRKKKTQR